MLFLLLLSLHLTSATRVCRSVNVRNSVSSLRQLEGCTVVEGHVQVVLIERANDSDFANWSFPELREVTEYLLFYRVPGLHRLGQLFPSLSRVGGTKLFLDYGLVVHEMFGLREIGLSSLQEITRGSVIITKNPSLCYVHTVDWDRIAPWDPNKNYVATSKPSHECPRCPADCDQGLCWSRDQCQIQEQLAHCDPQCVGACSGPGPRDCHSCRKLLTADGECTTTCPNGTYQYLNRRCVTKEECLSIDVPSFHTSTGLRSTGPLRHLVFNNTCVDSCPAGYELNARGESCEQCRGGRCLKHCPGVSIENISDAQALRGCTHIDGSLVISIRAGKSKTVMEELEESLGSIEEIGSYLKVVRSCPIVNLKFLRNLTTIRGDMRGQCDAGFGDNYSLLVLDNTNLQELWDWSEKPDFKILAGKVFFHYNPKLCLQHIYKLLSVSRYVVVSDLDVGKDSNGDKFSCKATKINISVTHKTSNAIEIRVPHFKVDYDAEDLRYVLYFTKALHKNVSLVNDFDECSDLEWRTKDFSVNTGDRHFINRGFKVNLTDLEPYTQYAFYVTAYTEDRYGAKSAIYYETTLPSKPSELTQLMAFTNKSFEVMLQWKPPEKVNGKIMEYIITWSVLQQNESLLSLRNYCEHPSILESPQEMFWSLTPPSREETDKKQISCCPRGRESVYSPKAGFEQLCLAFDRCHFGRLVEKYSQNSCESCFYSFIYNPPFPTSALTVNDFDVSSKYTRRGMRSKTNLFRKEIPKTFVARVSGSSTEFTITNLHHFQDYLVTVRACRESHPMEQDQSAYNRCSNPDIITTRTLREDSLDRVNNIFINEVFNDTVIMSWDTPTDPNGVVVAFEIEYKLLHADNINPIVNCFTFLEYSSKQNKYSIVGLSLGSYEARVRAITLAGKGPFTKYVYFNITKSGFSALIVLYFTLILCLIIALASLGLVIYYKQKHRLDILIASVKPHYQYVQDHWEIPRDNVELRRELGAGSFGKVYEGVIKSKNQPCAVKTVSDNVTEYGVFVFLSEASVMKSVAEAYHIVRLLGVVSTVRPPWVVMELMTLGDLKSYLRSTRETDPPSLSTLIKMACQIGDGMTFMEAKKYVHRDLAARNCLISEDHVVKVGDFGMARDVFETDYYRKTNTGLLPIRWMAPESLNDGVFTSQSDVWSYGVVLWEMVTLAEQPYQGASNEQVLSEVIAGRRLEFPPQAPKQLRTIMKSCWMRKPSQRMSFMQIMKSLENYHSEEFRKVAYFYTKEAQSLRKTKSDYVEMQSVDDPLAGQSLNTL